MLAVLMPDIQLWSASANSLLVPSGVVPGLRCILGSGMVSQPAAPGRELTCSPGRRKLPERIHLSAPT